MNFLSIFSIFSKKGGGGGGGDANVDNITLQKVGDTLSFKVKTSGDKNKVWKVKTDGTWNLANINEWKLVPTFVGEEGNTYTLYCLTEDVTISNVKYPKGFYTWDSENGFVARSSVVEVDNVTIDKDEDGKLEIKLEGIETKHIKPSALAKSTDNVRNYQNSVDTKAVTEKFLQKTLLNIETPENNKDAANKKYVDDEIQKVVERTFTFKGFISPTAPTGTIKVGSFWYESATLPTTFTINVKTYDGTNWSSTTSEYSLSQFDYFINDNDGHNYYWNGNKWKIFDSEALVDNITIERNNEGKLEVKDDGITKDKLNSNVADNDTIEKDSINGLQLKDEGITFSKFNPNLTKQSLANDYYFEFSDGTNTYYTKTIVDGNNIDVFSITITDDKITAITLQEAKGTLANDVLTFSNVEYAHDIFGDGFYAVGDDEILITISALQDVLERAGKVNDVKLANKSIVDNKEANIETIDNVEDNFYYAWKNGSNYIYIKSKAIGTNKNTYLFTYTDNVLTKITLSDKKSEIKLNSSGVLVATYDSNDYTYDTTKDDYYIIDPKYKLPSIENETRDFTQDELDSIFEKFYVNPNPVKRYTDNNAFVYRTTASAGYTITGDYSSNTPRTLWVQGKMAHLSFTSKGTSVANGAAWTYLGQIPQGLRPKYQFSIVGMVYNTNTNEAAGGYVTTDGQVVLWTNPKVAGNNYQVRVSCSYEIQD